MGEIAVPRAGYLAVGLIVGPHGIRGEVKVEVLTDFPERFAAGQTVHLLDDAGEATVSMDVVASREHKGRMLVKFKSVDTRNAAEELRDRYLVIPEDQAMPLSEHENYVHDLMGLTVVTASGEVLGRLTEILFTAANDVYVVAGPAGEVLLPALRDVVLSVDLSAGKMVVAPPEGLVE